MMSQSEMIEAAEILAKRLYEIAENIRLRKQNSEPYSIWPHEISSLEGVAGALIEFKKDI
jgi:hypothetical protein